MEKYKITYANGISQIRMLISHDVYLNTVKPLETEIDYLKTTIKKKSNDKNEIQKKELLKTLQNKLKYITPISFFTDKSPLFYAIVTGVIDLPLTQGGKHECKIEHL